MQIANGFTLIEVLVVVTLLSLIVVALMGVFTATQKAFRLSMTQTDVLEGGRAAMDLITSDLKAMSPSLDYSNGAANFCVTNYPAYAPLYQTLAASPGGQSRTNVQQNIFILSRGNLNGVPMWTGTGYAVYLSANNLYSLYRFSTNRPVASAFASSNLFYTDFRNFLNAPANASRLLEGVVGFRVSAFDDNGWQIITNQLNVRTNYMFGGVGCLFYSNTLPASVEIEMATLEDRTLQHASVWPNNTPSQTAYLAKQAGNLHVFRQRISIPNANAAAYQ